MNVSAFRAARSLEALGAAADRYAGTVGVATGVLLWPAGLAPGAIQIERNKRAYERWTSETNEDRASIGVAPFVTSEVRGASVRLTFRAFAPAPRGRPNFRSPRASGTPESSRK